MPMPNHLAGETSPYLLQHADNPVDWYFAEGTIEGPRKLQGYKALNSRHAQLKTEKIARELNAFLDRFPSVAGSELEKAARDRALAILNTINIT